MTRSTDVDAWLDAQPDSLREALARAREIILDTDERIDESIKWKTPTYSYKGNILSFTGGTKSHVSLMFHRGAEIPGHHPSLEGGGRLVRTMRLADMDAVEAAQSDLASVIRSWCQWKDG